MPSSLWFIRLVGSSYLFPFLGKRSCYCSLQLKSLICRRECLSLFPLILSISCKYLLNIECKIFSAKYCRQGGKTALKSTLKSLAYWSFGMFYHGTIAATFLWMMYKKRTSKYLSFRFLCLKQMFKAIKLFQIKSTFGRWLRQELFWLPEN